MSLVLGVSLISACSDSDSNTSSTGNTVDPRLRVIHASPDAPAVNVYAAIGLDPANRPAPVISALDYAQSSGALSVPAGSYDIIVEGIIPGGNADVITVSSFALSNTAEVTVFAVEPVSAIEPLVVNNSASTPSSSGVALAVVHASPDAPAVDVYVTAPGADISSIDPTLSFSFKESVDAGVVPVGQYQIRVTLAGTKTVVFDSGTVDLSGFGAQKLMIAALSNTSSVALATSPIKLLVATDTAQLTLFDTATSTGARVTHVSPDAGSVAGGPVEVFASSSVLPTSPTELIDAFSYTDIVPNGTGDYVAVPAGDYIFDVAPNTDTIGDSVFTSPALTLAAGEEYSVFAVGRVAMTPAFSLLATLDTNRSVATEARVKVVHAAPAAGIVDVFVTPAGAFTPAEVEAGMAGAPLLDDFAFSEISDYVAVSPGSYDIRVLAGGMTAINVEGFALTAGLVASVVARGPIEPAGAPADFNVIVLTN